MKPHAVALRAFTHAGDSFAKDQVLLNMDLAQFNDWSAPGVDLVREATDAEVAKARTSKRPSTEPEAPATA